MEEITFSGKTTHNYFSRSGTGLTMLMLSLGVFTLCAGYSDAITLTWGSLYAPTKGATSALAPPMSLPSAENDT